MHGFENFDWSNSTAEAQLAVTRRATPDQLRSLARNYDWRSFPEEVLSWAMAQKAMDLGSALTAFINGGPERFNYMHKREVPDRYRGAARVLDNICLRVNSGFYLSQPGSDVENRSRLDKWLSYQEADRSEGRRGRWILDERIIAMLESDALTLEPGNASAPQRTERSVLRDVLSPVMDLGVSREYLKYLPEEYLPKER